MEQILNIRTSPGWDKKQKFVITTYKKDTLEGLNKMEGQKEVIHREEITFESMEDLTEMITRIATYNREEVKYAVDHGERFITEKILTQL